MQEIKVFLHNNRVADVIEKLMDHGYLDPKNPRRCRNLNVASTKSLSRALDAREQRYSVELGQAVINESKLELLCEDDQVDAVVALIAATARTGQEEAGWIYVTRVEQVAPIGAGGT